MTWFERYKARYNDELKAFDEYGIEYSIDETSKEKGIIKFILKIEAKNKHFKFEGIEDDINLIVECPDLYPFFRPEVIADDINLPRHQNPFGKNLCLLPRETSFWLPNTLIAEYLIEQLPKVIIKGSIVDKRILASDKHEQAEPVSEYFISPPNAVTIIDTTKYDNISIQNLSIVTHIGVAKLGFPEPINLPSRCVTLECLDEKNEILSSLPKKIEPLFSLNLNAPIYYCPAPPPTTNPLDGIKWLEQTLSENNIKYTPSRFKIKEGIHQFYIDVVGITFPEENAPGNLSGRGWLFLVSKKRIKGKNNFSTELAYYSKVSRINSDSINIRVPQLKSLSDKNIAVFGLGALGAYSAIELARNGVSNLTLVDYDIVDASTTVRWPFGISQAGLYKTDILKEFIETNYPKTAINIVNEKIGNAFHNLNTRQGYTPQQDTLDGIFRTTSLIFDATAEIGVMNYLSYEAWRRDIPYICIHATEGGIGGLVFRYNPNKKQGCWWCLKRAQDLNKIPVPPTDESGKIQPIGCGDPTFTGASFDLINISLAGIRLAVSTLCENEDNGYPKLDWDVAILSFVDENKIAIAPEWNTFYVTSEPDCPYCGKKE